jgi:hypothetical protein
MCAFFGGQVDGLQFKFAIIFYCHGYTSLSKYIDSSKCPLFRGYSMLTILDIPANHVGGDFFQYFQQDGKLFVCMADVTGHAMEVTVPVMMFSGVLEEPDEVGCADRNALRTPEPHHAKQS